MHSSVGWRQGIVIRSQATPFTVQFQIPREEYDHLMEPLEPFEIGDPFVRDCNFEKICDNFSVLKQLEQTSPNLDKLDYFAKQFDSFDYYEKAQFLGMASRLGLHGVIELFNLTICCQ